MLDGSLTMRCTSSCWCAEDSSQVKSTVAWLTSHPSLWRWVTILTSSFTFIIATSGLETIIQQWLNVKIDDTVVAANVGQTTWLWWTTIHEEISISNHGGNSISKESSVRVNCFNIFGIPGSQTTRRISDAEEGTFKEFFNYNYLK